MSNKFSAESGSAPGGDFSKIEDQQKIEQLPPEEKEVVIGAAQEEMADIHKKARALAGDDEKPTTQNYQEASEQIDSEKEQKENILTPEQERTKQEMIEGLLKGYINDALIIAIGDKFSLPEEIIFSPEVQQAAKEGFLKCVSDGYFDSALAIRDMFSLPEEIIFSPEVQQAAMEGIIERLSGGYLDSALAIRDKFSVNAQPNEIIAAIPKLSELLSKLENIIPGFSEQARRSLDAVMSLCGVLNNDAKFTRTIKENPFLKDAFFENPSFALKLIIQYPRFDKLSQENIETLFNAKKQILADNHDIDQESLEFRQLMQEQLKEYKNNPEILEALEQSGVKVDEWLNYSETKYFNLESGESHLAFSEVVSTPINRIKETIDSYAHTLKNVLKEYRPELSEFKISLEDAKETEEKIAKMQAELEKARVEGNDKKAQGIERGIDGLKNKIENIKTVAVWDKLLGDISAFQQLKNDVFSAQEKLMQAENDLQEKLSGKMPSGKMIQELKEKIGKAKEELRGKFGILERRIEDFKTNLPGLISPCLGQDSAGSLIQEIETNLAEQFDHYNADRGTLANLFSEKSDKEKEKMENQPMSIFVWARNPDIDLYQGNYSSCCIRIDSELMGAESTIVDYNTDLGIQIVNIWDETKNEPITAAWCWLGKDDEGNTALVVDNIESNTLFSANYSEQLTKELFDYLKEYAKAVGAKKIVLGKANNDLPTAGELAKMREDSGEYNKIGGYNRTDGYFLEAEEKSVKLLWEEKEPAKEMESKKKKRSKED